MADPVVYIEDRGLTDKQIKCIEYMVQGDLTQREIADLIDVHEMTITKWKRKDNFMAALDEGLKEKKDRALRLLYSKSDYLMKKYLDLVNSKDSRTQGMVIKDMLNRIYGKPTAKLEVDDIKADDNDELDIEKELERIRSELISADTSAQSVESLPEVAE